MSEIEKKPCRTIAPSGTEKSLFEDEALETMWELGEKGDVRFKDVVADVGDAKGVKRMEKDGLIVISGEMVSFTEEGRCRARDITRRYLLAERLFADVLSLKDYKEDACRFEHAISPEVEEAICTFLGHPPTCPHGRAIPRGECCKVYTRKIKPLVQSLADVEVGISMNVVFISTPHVDRLASMGLMPGAVIKLHQKKPSYVLSIDETTLAVDEEIVRGIYVK